MFLLVSVRNVGAHRDELQHGVSIQISISYTKYSSDPNLDEGLCIFISFHFPDSGLSLLNGFDFYLIYFEWRDTEN